MVSKQIHYYRIGYSVMLIEDDRYFSATARTLTAKEFGRSHTATSSPLMVRELLVIRTFHLTDAAG
ncbi:MAG: hypothetical protein LZF60_370020 [Nitrospira sp.]|nr:MAG: hypothetical protein LZF60_370020 [Nitrospira sp.]